MLLYFLVIKEQFSDQCTELTEWRLERGGGELKTSAQVPGFCYIFFDVTNLRLIVNRSY